MSLKTPIKLRSTVAFRLTLWYAAIFTLSCGAAFLVFYLLMTSVLQDQVDQELSKQVGVFSSLLATRGTAAVKNIAVLEAQASGEKKVFFRLLYPSGETFSSSNMSYWQDIAIENKAIRKLLQGADRVFDTIAIEGRKHQVRILYAVIGPSILLQLGQSMENIQRFVQAFWRIFLATVAALIAISAGVGWFMARRAVSGVESVTRTARQITEGDLNQRVPVKPRGDEIDQLATTFNEMLDRIQSLVANIQEMSDNIAHDLKSPMARIRGTAEISLTTAKTVDEFKTMGASVIEECDRLLDMINTMLVISKTEAGAGDLKRQVMDISEVLRDACELFQPVAEQKGVTVICSTPASLPFAGDMRLVQRMIANLLDNAIKYTPAGGRVELTAVAPNAQQMVVTILDTGIGISEKDLPNIFKRFYRCDQSRSQPGVGLGLSLARAIARAHGGDITVSSRPESGSTFTISLASADITKR